MQHCINQAVQWIDDNNMIINSKKTKELVISFKKTPPVVPTISVKGQQIERVTETKLLGLRITSDLRWDSHIDYIYKKASSRLYFLKHLRRSGLSRSDLSIYYKTVIRSVMEYAAPAWYTSTTQSQRAKLNCIQKRALRIISPELSQTSAEEALKIEPICDRLDSLCHRMFRQMMKPDHALYNLLPIRRPSTYTLRCSRKFILPKTNSIRFKTSFVPYGLYNYQ
jgi:hypothetical protein